MSNQKAFAHIAVILLIFVVIILSAIFFSKQIWISNNKSPALPNTTNEAEPPPPKIVDAEKKGWLTYINSVHQYSVEYPSDWKIDTIEANNEEYYQDSICCNTATLTLSKDDVTWEFHINTLITGYLARRECEGLQDKCSYESVDMEMLGYNLKRVVVRSNESGKIVTAHLSTPIDEGRTTQGFGKVGISTDYVSPDYTLYHLNYEGDDIDKYLGVLDQISESLQHTQ